MGGQRSERRKRAFSGYVRRGVSLLAALLIGMTESAAVRATEVPDDGFLEFLGSVDSEDKDWHDYLARTDIDKVARRAAPGTNPPPATNSPPAAQPAPAAPPPDAGKPVVPP
jgi:hypothetical protein